MLNFDDKVEKYFTEALTIEKHKVKKLKAENKKLKIKNQKLINENKNYLFELRSLRGIR